MPFSSKVIKKRISGSLPRKLAFASWEEIGFCFLDGIPASRIPIQAIGTGWHTAAVEAAKFRLDLSRCLPDHIRFMIHRTASHQ